MGGLHEFLAGAKKSPGAGRERQDWAAFLRSGTNRRLFGSITSVACCGFSSNLGEPRSTDNPSGRSRGCFDTVLTRHSKHSGGLPLPAN
jgi:hypothetical protein